MTTPPAAPLWTLDLHYHANVHGRRRETRRRRMAAHRDHLAATGVDLVASTEHAYKGPLDAFQRLAEAAADLPTAILPGVEAVSSDGVDVIFLFRSEADLRAGLPALAPFAWRWRDTARLASDLGALTILAHPFTPGRSGIVTRAGEAGLADLLPLCDFVEAGNGTPLLLSHTLERRGLTRRRVLSPRLRDTLVLPEAWRAPGMGLAIGSDAHFAGHQVLVGALPADGPPPADWFPLLATRPRMTPLHPQGPNGGTVVAGSGDLARSLRCAAGEAVRKAVVKRVA